METNVVGEGGKELISAAKELRDIKDDMSSSADFAGINRELCITCIETVADSCEYFAWNAGVFG